MNQLVFSSAIFLFAFLPLCLIGYAVVPKLKKAKHPLVLKNVFLLAASLFFYAWGEPRFVLVMIASILLNYAFALRIDRVRENAKRAKLVLTAAIVLNFGLLFVFKYMGFAQYNVERLFGVNLGLPSLALPIGISFFTFQAMSYVIDVYRQKGEVQTNPINVALYIALFPQLIAGPIVRYETVAREIQTRTITLADVDAGARRFIYGLAKKLLLANHFAEIADMVFARADLTGLGSLTVWLSAIAYMMQIYFDFSGYSDMAIGLGRMFGFHFDENFNYPYAASSITDFWRRWHISLSTWFRDYVYFPMGGSRVKSRVGLIFNLFVVWSLTGAWHGANWTFFAWGLYYFVLLVAEKMLRIPERLKVAKHAWLRGIYHAVTLVFVLVGWVLFRDTSWTRVLTYLKTMFVPMGQPFWDWDASFMLRTVPFMIVGCVAAVLGAKVQKYADKLRARTSVNILEYIALFLLFFLSLCAALGSTNNPFIYFNF
ncbi:MAG: MBOAT family protein [Oscillospiraceae bacterium]|nr:MBOAT family protein [Oscillospiraceae bacterium]